MGAFVRSHSLTIAFQNAVGCTTDMDPSPPDALPVLARLSVSPYLGTSVSPPPAEVCHFDVGDETRREVGVGRHLRGHCLRAGRFAQGAKGEARTSTRDGQCTTEHLGRG